MQFKAKCSLIGDESTGKTSLILRYIKNTFSASYITTLGADFVEKTYVKDDLSQLSPRDELTIVYWDMAGQAAFQEIATIYCEGSSGIIIVFDVNERKSFESLPNWVSFTRRVCDEAEILIVGNKSDLEWSVSEKEIKAMEEKLNVQIVIASAKRDLNSEDSNVLNIFQMMAGAILEKFYKQNK
jgi:small GTP-binding protein